MEKRLIEKLDYLASRYQEINNQLSDAAIISDQNQYRKLTKEFSDLEPVVLCYQQYQRVLSEYQEAEQLLTDPDPEMRQMGKEEILSCEQEKERLEQELRMLMLPEDPNDQRNVFLEIRAGTGGDEAAIFVGDLFRMYCKYGEKHRWNIEIFSEHLGDQGGYKEIVCRVSGRKVYSHLKFEAGTHRVQRVPATESQGRIHTSACTVAVLPELEGIQSIAINKQDLRVDTFRSSGAGGQHVNTTDSAIRLTHIPTGIVVECQDERSQHKNKARAMSLLQAKLVAKAQEEQTEEQSHQRKLMVGSGDRSERIRTYNFPQGRITDHRINLTLYKLQEVLAGDLEELVTSLKNNHQANLLAAMSE